MFQIKNFTDNDDVRTLDSKGPFTVIEYQRDLSVTPGSAQTAYFCNEMNVRKRQVICDLSKAQITLQAGAMQWTVGNVNATTGVKADNTFLVYQDTYIMGDPGWFMHATEVEVPEKYFTVK